MNTQEAAPPSVIDFSGRTVLVTGASGGIGREIAALLSSLRARVVITGRDQARLDQTLSSLAGRHHHAELFDLADTAAIVPWLSRLAGDLGPFDGIVHCAGRQATIPIRMVTPQNAEELFRTNVYSAVMLASAFAGKQSHTKNAAIVFVASIMGLVGESGLSVYSATKAALIGFTRSLSLELARDHIRVNCIAPAGVQTPMLENLRRLALPHQFAALEKAHPLGFGTPADVASAAAFLLSDAARWITGTTLVLDGGYSAQ